MTITNTANPTAPAIMNPTNAPINASAAATTVNVMSKSDNTDALVSAFLTGRAVIIISTKPINAITPANAANPTAPFKILELKVPINASAAATTVNVMSKSDNTDALVSAFLTGRAVIIISTKPINAITPANAANPTAPFKILELKVPINASAAATTVNVMSKTESANALVIAFFTGRAVIIISTKPINAMTPANAANPTTPFKISELREPIPDNAAATTVNVMSKTESTNALVMAFFTGRAVIIINTKPINPNTTVKATIAKAIEVTCLRSIDFELLMIYKAADKVSISRANDSAVLILEPTSNVENCIRITLRTAMTSSINIKGATLTSLRFLVERITRANAPNTALSAITAAYNLLVSSIVESAYTAAASNAIMTAMTIRLFLQS